MEFLDRQASFVCPARPLRGFSALGNRETAPYHLHQTRLGVLPVAELAASIARDNTNGAFAGKAGREALGEKRTLFVGK